MPDQEPKRPRGNPRWVPGGPSPNPGGRSVATSALQAAIRRKCDPDELVEIALSLARSGKEATQIAALQWLAATGYDRPVSTTKIEVSAGPPPGWAELSAAERRELLDRAERGDGLPEIALGAGAAGLLAQGD